MTTSKINEAKKARAQQLKVKGEAAYKKEDFGKAGKFYKEASALDSENPTYQSNLSAVEFEDGNYQECLQISTKALSLIDTQISNPASDPTFFKSLQRKLLYRKARCHLQLFQYDEAIEMAKQLGEIEGQDGKMMEGLIVGAEALRRARTVEGDLAMKRLAAIPLYRPIPSNSVDFFRIGQEFANSILTFQFAAKEDYFPPITQQERKFRIYVPSDPTKDWECAAFFGGVSDAKGLFATLVDVGIQLEAEGKGKFGVEGIGNRRNARFHVTCSETKPQHLAKLFLVLIALEELSHIPHEHAKGQRAREILDTLYMISLSGLIPPDVYAIFEGLLKKATNLLKPRAEAFEPFELGWLYLEPNTVKAVLGVLVWWKGPATTYSDLDNISFEESMPPSSVRADKIHGPYSCKAEYKRYSEVMILRPPVWSSEPTVERLYRKGKVTPEVKSAAKKRVQEKWKVNVTFLDQSVTPLLTHDPYDTILKFWVNEPMRSLAPGGISPPNASGAGTLIAWSERFFFLAAEGLRRLRERGIRHTLEIVLGDAFKTLERIDLKALRRRDDFPVRFDRIHCNNVPDYTGGNLVSFTLGVALLKPLPTSYYCSNSLLNSYHFPGGILGPFESYLDSTAYTYAGISGKEIEPVFGVKALHDVKTRNPTFYYIWQNLQNLPSRLPNAKIRRILHQIWFILTMPACSGSYQACEPRRNLNINTLFRFWNILYRLGYPSHIFNDFIQRLLSGSFSTYARPAVKVPLKPPTLEENETLPSASFSVTPFLEDFKVAAALWQSAVDFPIWATGIPRPEEVGRYCVQLPDPELAIQEYLPTQWPGLILVIASAKDMNPVEGKSGIKHYYTRLLQNKPIPLTVNFIQTLHWNSNLRIATFPLLKKTAEGFRNKGGMEIALVNPTCWRIYSRIVRWEFVRQAEGSLESIDVDSNFDASNKTFPPSNSISSFSSSSSSSSSMDPRIFSRPLPISEILGWKEENEIRIAQRTPNPLAGIIGSSIERAREDGGPMEEKEVELLLRTYASF